MPLINLANPTRFLALADRVLPWLAGLTALLLAVGLWQAALAPDDYTLTIRKTVTSVFGQRMAADYASDFTAVSDLSNLIRISFDNTRFDRATGTVSYDVTLTNVSERSLLLPVLLALDPADGYDGLPANSAGRADDGRWLIDFTGTLPAVSLTAAATTRSTSSGASEKNSPVPPAANRPATSCSSSQAQWPR